MGDEGLDKWHMRMSSHKRRGDKIIIYDGPLINNDSRSLKENK